MAINQEHRDIPVDELMERSWFRKTIVAFVSGALIGGVLTTWFGPRLISWWAEPPAFLGVSCRPAIMWAFRRFEWLQMFGLIGGGILAIILYSIFFKRKNQASNLEIS